MELIGTIKQVFQPQSGISKNTGNTYTTQTIIITYGDQYPKDLALTLMTKQVEQYGGYLRPGLRLKFSFDASSKEYNGRYYTECTVWKIESLQAQLQAAPMAAPAPMPAPAQVPNTAPQQQYPPQSTQPTMPNYGPQYGASQQPQYQAPPSNQQFGPTVDDLPWD